MRREETRRYQVKARYPAEVKRMKKFSTPSVTIMLSQYWHPTSENPRSVSVSTGYTNPIGEREEP